MGALKQGSLLLLVLSSLIAVEAQQATGQNPLAAFGQNLRSGAIAQSIQSILGTNGLLWLAFFAIFSIVAAQGIKTAWPDMQKASKGILSVAIGALLTFGLVRLGIDKLLPQNNLVTFALLALAITFGLHAFKNKEGKPKIGLVPALFIALLLSWLILNGTGLLQGKGFSPLGNVIDKRTNADIQARILYGGTSNDPNTNWVLAQDALRRYDYTAARTYFALIVAAGPGPHNRHYDAAADYINIGGKDKLFRQMADHYDRLFAVQYSAADALLARAEKLPKGSEERNRLEQQATTLLRDIVTKKEDFCKELEKRQRKCKS